MPELAAAGPWAALHLVSMGWSYTSRLAAAQTGFRPFVPSFRLLLELLTALLRGKVAFHDEQFHRAACGEHCDIAAVSHTTSLSLGLDVPPAEVAALEFCSPKCRGMR